MDVNSQNFSQSIAAITNGHWCVIQIFVLSLVFNELRHSSRSQRASTNPTIIQIVEIVMLIDRLFSINQSHIESPSPLQSQIPLCDLVTYLKTHATLYSILCCVDLRPHLDA